MEKTKYIIIYTFDVMSKVTEGCDVYMLDRDTYQVYYVNEMTVADLAGFLGALALVMPKLWRRTSYLRFRLRMWARYKRNVAEIRREHRRYKAAMKVFEKPVRWREM